MKPFNVFIVLLAITLILGFGLWMRGRDRENQATTFTDCTFVVDPNDVIGLDEWGLTITDCNFIDLTDTAGVIKF